MGMAVLLADDSAHAQRMGAQFLADLGHQVLNADRGSAVLERLLLPADQAQTLPEAIISDHTLRELPALDLLHMLGEDPALAGIARIIAVAPMETPDRPALEAAGADAFVQKPFTLDGLREALEQALKKAQTRRATPQAVGEPAGDALLARLLHPPRRAVYRPEQISRVLRAVLPHFLGKERAEMAALAVERSLGIAPADQAGESGDTEPGKHS